MAEDLGLAMLDRVVAQVAVQVRPRGLGTMTVKAQVINQLYQINMLETTEIRVVAPQLAMHRYTAAVVVVVVLESRVILLEDIQDGVMAAMV